MERMDRVTLGRSGLEVTPIAFGAWQLGGDWGEYEVDEAIAAIRAAREAGVNLFDTAHAYGFGRSERVLGEALAAELRSDRESLVIATKGGLRPSNGGVERDSSPDCIRHGVAESLKALGVDYIDLLQVHWPDPDTAFAETAATLAELVDAGKVRHVGVSNFDAAQIEEFSRTLQVETLQPPYHLFRREIERNVLPYCAEHEIGVLVYGPLAHGLLSGAFDENPRFPEGDWRARSDVFKDETLRRNLAAVAELERLAAERGWKLSQLAVAWTLAHAAVHVAIVGTRNPAHIAEAVEAAQITLHDSDLDAIDEIMGGAVQVGGPTPEAA
jgi:aryl-alcohol dehydrogenase-like predicted oxidoreductase